MKTAGNIFSLLILLLFTSCKKSRCYKVTGDETTTVRSLNAFRHVILEDNIDLILFKTNEYSAEIQGGANVIEHINFDINGDSLIIFNGNKCNWLRSYKNRITVTLSFEDIEALTYKGGGTVTCKNQIETDTFNVYVRHGSGNVELDVFVDEFDAAVHTGSTDLKVIGSATDALVYSAGYGKIDFSELINDNTYVHSAGSNSVTVNPGDYLWVEFDLQPMSFTMDHLLILTLIFTVKEN